MHILPMIDEKYCSPHSSMVLSKRLSDITDRSGENVFVGTVKDDSFSVYKKPAEYVRNSFLPIAKGTFRDIENGCEVTIKMHMHPVVTIFMLIWSLGVLGVLVMGILEAFMSGFSEALLLLLSPILMLAVESLLLFIGFHLPARKLLNILIRTFS